MYFIKIEKIIRLWHIRFRRNELLSIPNLRIQKTQKVFSIFQEARTQLVKYCDLQIKLRYSSTELVLTEFSIKIIPKCYVQLLHDFGE